MEKLLISDAAKQVQVESHVLRYWEEELHLPIQRNKQGHRYYTTEDVNRFKQIKTMKEQGFQLKAIRSALDGNLTGVQSDALQDGKQKQESKVKKAAAVVATVEEQCLVEQDKAGKAARLQFLLQHMIAEAVRENNEQLCENVKQVVVKEMDYQFRQQEEREQEREEQRMKREEEHYRQLDMLLRGKNKKESKKERRRNAFGLQKQSD